MSYDETTEHELTETTCDDCGADTYIDAAGELYDDEAGLQVHPADCTADEGETFQLVELLSTLIDDLDALPELPKYLRAPVKRLSAAAQRIISEVD